MKLSHVLLLICLGVLLLPAARAEENGQAPWGGAKAQDKEYAPQKVVYDVAVPNRDALEGVLDRVSYLNKVYQANPFETSIVLVLHGGEIPFFAIRHYPEHEALMTRAQSLTVGGTIHIRMCEQAARAHGFKPEDIHGFVEIVPMADAEIVRLQQEEGYVYMR